MTPPPTPEAGIERARATLLEARDSMKLGHHRLAVNRAYYASFYACLALLRAIGVEAKTHDGVATLVAHHFVRVGKLPPDTSRLLKHLEGDRELADYDFSAVITADDAVDAVSDAERFVAAAAAALAS